MRIKMLSCLYMAVFLVFCVMTETMLAEEALDIQQDVAPEAISPLSEAQHSRPKFSGGTPVPANELEAVGRIPGCTATLITQDLVLTAAHCVCTTANNCNIRSTFTLENVFPMDDPDTTIDESLSRSNVSISGNVRVHPEYELRGWQREDIAIIELDQPANTMAKGVMPIPVEEPGFIPNPGDLMTLVGYGGTGVGCTGPSMGKLKLELPVIESMWGGIKFSSKNQHVCPGDSGGPILNTRGRVVGVASWGNNSDESTYRPTSFSYSWIFDLPQPGWSSCQWVEVGGVKSHNPHDAWCPDGSFLTQFDLDGDRTYAEHDTPIVGRARCCKYPGHETSIWGQCSWEAIGNSHQRDAAWCPVGSFLTQFDLDGDRSLSAHDAPVVGQARCCKLQGIEFFGWGSCYWIDVGDASHQQGASWGPEWGFLTAFDQDSDHSLAAHDSPLVGQAMFCDLGETDQQKAEIIFNEAEHLYPKWFYPTGLQVERYEGFDRTAYYRHYSGENIILLTYKGVVYIYFNGQFYPWYTVQQWLRDLGYL